MFKYWVVVVCLISTTSLSLRYNYGNGSYYVGEVDNNGRPTGYGLYYNEAGKLEYEGEWADGFPNGNGTQFGPNGDIYKGEFVDGKAHGYVVHTTADGDRMEGQFQDNMADGPGILIRKDGQVVEGQFKRGMAHGEVRWKGQNGEVMEGRFRMGRPVGFVTLYDRNGSLIYEGNVEEKELPIEVLITYGLDYFNNINNGW